MYAIIRLRGSVNLRPEIKYTLKLLRLHKVNHCAVVEENEYNKGMIIKAKDYVAWGEISEETLESLFKSRGRLEGGKGLTEEFLKDETSFGTVKELAHSVFDGQLKMKDLRKYKIKPIFRLHPPRKGHKGIKHSVTEGGELGYHGSNIENLLHKMR